VKARAVTGHGRGDGFACPAAFDAVGTLPDVFARLGAIVSRARRVQAIGGWW
jgi:hypothetical protein